MKVPIQIRTSNKGAFDALKSIRRITLAPFDVLILCAFLFSYPVNLFGQEENIQKPVFKFQHVNRELGNNQVFTIFQDRSGFFWIGTLGGLHRIKGDDYDLFVTAKDTTSIPDSRVEKLFEDKHGNLWIGTHDGLARYNPDKNNFTRFDTHHALVDPVDPNTYRIKEITEDDNGTLWVACQRSGLLFFNEETQSFVSFFSKDTGNPLGTTNLTAIFPDKNGILWIGTLNDGLKKLNIKTKEVTHFRHDPNNPNSIAGNYIASIVIDKNNNLWVGTNFWGVDRMVKENSIMKFVHYKHNPRDANTLGNNDVRMLFVDSQNNVWSCNENGGLNLYSAQYDKFFCYLPNPLDPFSISSNSYWSIYEDQQERLWLGSSLSGIDVIDKNLAKFNHYYKTSLSGASMSNDIVRGFYEDTDGNLWIATDGGGLNFFDRKNNTFKAYQYDATNPTSITSNAVLTICEVNGELWVGTWQGGINVMDTRKKTFRSIETDNENLRSIFNLIKDSKGNVWASTYGGGITHFDPRTKSIRTYLNNPSDTTSISSNITPVIIEDSDGNIWIGTQDSGVNVMKADDIEKGVFQRYTLNSNDTLGLQSKLINDIFEDSRKNIWIATSAGLSKFIRTRNAFKTYSTQHGLPTEQIKSIIEDDKGFLWIGTTKGISKFNPDKESFINYDKSDGLQNGEFSRYGVYKTRQGELLFGGTHGFNAFRPESIRRNGSIPPVYITGLRIFNKPVVIGDEDSMLPKHISQLREITLSYEYSVFTLDFIALNSMVPDKNQYAYRLEGLEKNWNFVGNQSTATYTNLDPGVYFFHVKASNNEGVWPDTAKVIKITITPPLWKTWWFRTLLILSFIVSVYLVIFSRVRQLREKNIELEARVNDRTSQLRGLIRELQEKQDEIATTNEELTSTLEDLVEQKNKVEVINNELKSAHEELLSINNQLDERVHERTLKLLKSNQELDRFVYSASHDLSAPLKSILGLIQLTRLENKNEALTDHLEHMQKSVVKLEGVINSLTQFSRNMGHALIKQGIVFDEIVEEVLDELKYPFHADKVKIIKHYNDLDYITSDYLRLKIILSNLISNALKYKNLNNGRSIVEITYEKRGDHDFIQIRDNGIGITKENQLKVFDMFFRATLQSTGSGLGLYIVKETVEKLGGTITVDSVPGNYTAFTVNL
jgi:ligand-binding sensor domain-containing protein/signal transduction histidine kinase